MLQSDSLLHKYSIYINTYMDRQYKSFMSCKNLQWSTFIINNNLCDFVPGSECSKSAIPGFIYFFYLYNDNLSWEF